jgi:hypothetical protein
MSKKNKNLTVPTDEIKLLLKIRGQDQKRLAAGTGISYFVLNRFLNNITYKDRTGDDCVLDVPHIKTAIAKYLNIPSDILWSGSGSAELKKLIADEMVLKKHFDRKLAPPPEKKPWKISTFIKNIIALGK